MITVKEAQNKIIETTLTAPSLSIELEKANGKILAQDVLAKRHQPPFHRVAMDGIAINTSKKKANYQIEGVQAAGSPQLTLSTDESCIEVMTGATLPLNTNCVIPYERVVIENGIATIEIDDISEMKNVHQKASDYKENDILLRKGTLITSPVQAVIASQGLNTVSVYKSPSVAIISTGSELVDLGQPIKEHQIFMSNSYAIECELRNFGLTNIQRKHIVDDQEKTEKLIEECFKNFDLIILTGGVSKGKFDYIPSALENLGVQKLFHKIKQKPGKPMFYGIRNNTQVFGLPGNPVSCLVCLRRYVIPSILTSLGQETTLAYGELSEDVTFKKPFSLFKAVKSSFSKEGKFIVTPIKSNGSGDFNSLSASNGFIELPADREIFKKGEVFQFFNWHS